MGSDTEKLLALKFPNSHHLIPMIEDACSQIKTQNKGYGRASFDALGIDTWGKLRVKFVELGCRIFNRQDAS
jgi:hypothetical protein